MSGEKLAGVLTGLWQMLKRPSAKYSMLSILAVSFIGGIIFWGGFNTVMDATNKMEFCIGCHEMHDNVYLEYKKTIHYSNRTGVRAVCSDCHVPKDWTHKMIRKVQASREVWGKITGSISTPEKFEAKRLELAEREWARMKKNDSLECRNCHTFEGMAFDIQKDRSKKQHEIGIKENKTCIDCHQGIAHQKPKGMQGNPDDDV